MKKKFIDDLFIIISPFPTFGFFTFIGGATPFGVLLAPLTSIKFNSWDILALSAFIFLGLLSSFNYIDFFEFLKILLGPIVFLAMRSVNLENLIQIKPLLMLIIMIHLLDPIISGFDISSFRSTTILTHEPSHTARSFFLFIVFYRIVSDKRYSLLLIFFIFLLLNKSSTAFVSLVFYIFIFELRNLKLWLSSFAVVAALNFLFFLEPFNGVRFIATIDAVLSLTSEIGDIVQTVNAVGGPRLTLSLAAFESSKILGYGVGSGVMLDDLIGQENFIQPTNVVFILQNLPIVPASYLSQVSFEMGLLSASVLLLYLARTCVKKSLFLAGLFMLAFLSTTTMATPWLLFGLGANKTLRK